MAARQRGGLGLVGAEGRPSLAEVGSLSSILPGRRLARSEQRSLEELGIQRLVMAGTAFKTAFGMEKITEIHEHAAAEFEETTGTMLEIKNREHEREHQAYLDEFARHQIGLLAKHLTGAVEVGASNIGLEIHRSLYPEPEPLPPEPPSLWKRIFG